MKNIKYFVIKFFFLFSFFLIFLGFNPLTSFAIGQITSPIIIQDALRGHSYEERLTIVNTENAAVKLNLSAEGEIKDWTTFYKLDDLTKAINEIDLASGETIEIIAKFNVSTNASNGEYKGLTSVTKVASVDVKKNESVASVTQKIDRKISIIVSGKEVINFNASVIPESYDIALNNPIKVRIIYDNQGNTDIRPEIRVKTQTGDTVNYNVIFPYPENTATVKPKNIFEIKSLEIPTTGLSRGKHLMTLDFYVNNSLSLRKDFYFTMRDESEFKLFIMNITNNLNKQLPLVIAASLVIIIVIIISYYNIKRKKYNYPKKYQKVLKIR